MAVDHSGFVLSGSQLWVSIKQKGAWSRICEWMLSLSCHLVSAVLLNHSFSSFCSWEWKSRITLNPWPLPQGYAVLLAWSLQIDTNKVLSDQIYSVMKHFYPDGISSRMTALVSAGSKGLLMVSLTWPSSFNIMLLLLHNHHHIWRIMQLWCHCSLATIPKHSVPYFTKIFMY